MRVAIQTYGTRGDVQPYIALSLGLLARGHEVQITAPEQFEAMVREYGIAFAALPSEFLAIMETPEGKAAIAGGQGFSAGFTLLKHIRPLMRPLLDREWVVTKAFQPEVIVYHPKSIASPHMAEALECPAILASPLPGFTPTSAFPSPMLPFASLGPLNRPSHALVSKGADVIFGRQIRDWRSAFLGLSRRPAGIGAPHRTIYAYSRHIVPVPADWGPDVLVSGSWFLDHAAWRPPGDLKAFLDAGEPPVYIGFGSMPGHEPRRLAAIVIDALIMTGKRGLLATGGGALEAAAVPDNVHIIAGAPHDRLFQHVAATVHHGGAGTTAAALRAGKPMAICPFFGDQPFWGRRIAQLGVGPGVLDRKALTTQGLATALVAMDDTQMRQRAAILGAKIQEEDGLATALGFIERVCPNRTSRSVDPRSQRTPT